MGFVFWWTKDYDLRVSNLIIGIIIGGMIGIFTWVLGASIHGGETIIRKKRK